MEFILDTPQLMITIILFVYQASVLLPVKGCLNMQTN